MKRMSWRMRWELAMRVLRGEFHQVKQIQWGGGRHEILHLETHDSVASRISE
ncbi:hypothetical protein SEA_MAGRITTE_120 [Microbacterium phage Magritte]|nr:hypothetical protein SEA_MAGRITTE_120 [Microbacterium phage Magritte]